VAILFESYSSIGLVMFFVCGRDGLSLLAPLRDSESFKKPLFWLLICIR